MDDKAVVQIAQTASKAVEGKDLPTARVLLYSLMSEIRLRTSNSRLVSYPTALAVGQLSHRPEGSGTPARPEPTEGSCGDPADSPHHPDGK